MLSESRKTKISVRRCLQLIDLDKQNSPQAKKFRLTQVSIVAPTSSLSLSAHERVAGEVDIGETKAGGARSMVDGRTKRRRE